MRCARKLSCFFRFRFFFDLTLFQHATVCFKFNKTFCYFSDFGITRNCRRWEKCSKNVNCTDCEEESAAVAAAIIASPWTPSNYSGILMHFQPPSPLPLPLLLLLAFVACNQLPCDCNYWGTVEREKKKPSYLPAMASSVAYVVDWHQQLLPVICCQPSSRMMAARIKAMANFFFERTQTMYICTYILPYTYIYVYVYKNLLNTWRLTDASSSAYFAACSSFAPFHRLFSRLRLLIQFSFFIFTHK